jgi:hypothetical protein
MQRGVSDLLRGGVGMEQGYEEATKESARGGAWAAGRIGAQRAKQNISGAFA